MQDKQVFLFKEGNASMKNLLGGKGANLAEMTSLSLPIPPGFTITTEACRQYYAQGSTLTEALFKQVKEALKYIEEQKNGIFGDRVNPLLVSVRSGSVTSMPGMMDTILNLGLNDETVIGMAERTGNERFAFDCYRRFIQMFGDVVLGIHSFQFEKSLDKIKHEHGFNTDQQVTTEAWKQLIENYKQLVKQETGNDFPQDVYLQLKLAIEAVFSSWNNSRSKIYRKVYNIPDEQGTAVNVQSMVFGNMGEDSGTGVLFTRNPSTGENELYGEYLSNAQGEDVVAGVRTPKPIVELANEYPEVFKQLKQASKRLEQHYKDMQDIEFTVEKERLYLLQTRNGKRTAQAAVKIAIDLMEEGTISKEEGIERIEPKHLDQLLHRSIDTEDDLVVITEGLPASPGAASGQLVFDADLAEQWVREGKKVILAGTETTPEDIHGIIASEGVLTSRGGMTSHAAVVARGMGKPCVCGCESLRIDLEEKTATVGNITINEGDWISLDGATGKVIQGAVKLKDPEITAELSKLLKTADEIRQLKIYTNADNPEDAARAREFGAEGIGLCRTEHMFMSSTRLPVVQAMILSETEEDRKNELKKILPMQQADFEGIFTAMNGLPVTIRLLDPPLHEFLPDLEQLLDQRRELESGGNADQKRKAELNKLIQKVRSMHEANPMLGLRGCRLGILYPEIYDMQIEAIFRAVSTCLHNGIEVHPEIMIPLVGHPNELEILRKLVDQVAEQVLGADLRNCPYSVGTMIEVPRAAIVADQIAKHAEFFSFGTNDLTQMTFGYSRDDAEGKFLNQYLDRNILKTNPFQVLDQDGVGTLIDWAVTKGKQIRSALKTGVCGEHGGDRDSIFFCHHIGLDYVSCSPFRVPFARIAAAQAAILNRREVQQEIENQKVAL
jgi:pyruvate,orthophosphate dikinase